MYFLKKFEPLQLHFSTFFHYFNESACRWVEAKQAPCIYVTDSLVPITSLSSTATSPVKTTTATTTSTVITTASSSTTSSENQIAILIETNDVDTSPVDLEIDLDDDSSGDNVAGIVPLDRQFCETLEPDWICSNGNENLSLCFKNCPNGDTEQKRCKCKESTCSWHEKGNKCKIQMIPVQNFHSSLNTGHYIATNDQSPTIDALNPSSGNLPFTTKDLMSLIHQINLTNSGYINVNLNISAAALVRVVGPDYASIIAQYMVLIDLLHSH